MRWNQLLCAAVLSLSCLSLAAQERGQWRASSQTAQSITGDVALTDTKLWINFASYTVARIRALQPSEISAAFDPDNPSEGSGSLYRLSIPGSKVFLHKNTLCGGEDVQWMVAYGAGRSLNIAFFSGAKTPVLTVDAFSNSTDLCGVYTYTR